MRINDTFFDSIQIFKFNTYIPEKRQARQVSWWLVELSLMANTNSLLAKSCHHCHL